MTRGRARRYLLTKSDESYYPQVVADAGYDVWDWSTLNEGTMYQDSAKTLRVDRDALGNPVDPDGKPVGCWTDRVKLTDATQATTAVKPTYDAASLNGLPTLSFDGGDILATGDISISTFAVWVVFRNSATSPPIVYEHSPTVSSNDGSFVIASTTTILVKRSGVISAKNLNATWATDNTWRVVRHGHNGTHATHTLTINNINQTLSNVTVNDVGTGTATQPLYIGARSGVSFPMTGNIAHLCIVSPYPTAQIIATMESYINRIWSVY